MNQDFASFVREASFHLTLSSQMIEAILRIDLDTPKLGYGVLLGRSTSNALYRRGLVMPAGKVKVPEEVKDNPNWPYDYLLTDAGKLVAGLLKEAGFKCPAPCWSVEAEHEPEIEVTLKP